MLNFQVNSKVTAELCIFHSNPNTPTNTIEYSLRAGQTVSGVDRDGAQHLTCVIPLIVRF